MMNPLSNPGYLLPPLVAATISLVMVTLVLLKARRGLSTWLFCGLSINIVVWNFLIFGMRSSPDVDRAVIWIRIHFVVGFAIYILYYHFTRVYTNTKGQKLTVAAAYSLLLITALLAPTNLLIQGIRLESYGYAPILGTIGKLLAMVGLPFLGIAIYNLFRRYKFSQSYEERNRLLYLTIAPLFPVLGSILDGFTNLPPAGIWANMLFCVICSIGIFRYHLLDIQFIIRKSLAYLLASAIVALPYVGVLVLLSQVLGAAVAPWWVHTIIILLLAIVLRPLSDWMQHPIDKLFYRERYDLLRALGNFAQEAHDISDLNQLGSSLVNIISQALHSSGVYLLLPSSSGDFGIVSSTGEKKESRLSLDSDNFLLQWLQSSQGLLHRRELAVVPQLQSLSAKNMKELNKIRAELFVPLKTREGNLIGLIILGEKLSQQLYSEEDEHLILTVASRMAVELENARLFESEKTARKELEKQNEQKTEFLHSIAHELKTPLTAILSSSELLSEEKSIAPSLIKRLSENIRQSADRMDRRVSELLDLARMQTEEPRLTLEPLEIGLVITDVASQLDILFKNKGQTLALEIPRSLAKVNGDKGRLEQVLTNLLSNANKFSPAGSNIVLRAREADRKVIVEVEDTAEALTEVERGKVFNPYYRGEDADKRERLPGLGLGLAISKKLVELHYGEIWVKGNKGRGNTFGFSLPAYQNMKGVE
jgi:signal transduction histidine kinase